MPTTVPRPRDPEDGFDAEGRPTDPWPDAEAGSSALDGAMPRRVDGTLPFPVAMLRGEGDCYEAAGKVMIEDGLNTDEFGFVPADEVLLCHGRMTSPPIGGHAWNEARGHVYDLSNGRIVYMPIDEYYRTFGIKDVIKYTRSEAFRIILKLKQWGPWDDDPRMASAEPPCPCECNRGEFCGGCGHRGCGMRRERPAGSVPPCPCECNRGEFCGGCGHAGCGGRRSKKASREPFITDLGPEIGSTVLPDGEVLGRYGVWAWDDRKGKYQVVDAGDDLAELQRKHGVPDSDVTQIRGAARTAKEATVELSHLIGAKDEAISFLPALPAVKEARRDFSYSEKSALIEEAPDRRARNQGKLDLAGTHYVSSTPEELDDLTNPLFW